METIECRENHIYGIIMWEKGDAPVEIVEAFTFEELSCVGYLVWIPDKIEVPATFTNGYEMMWDDELMSSLPMQLNAVPGRVYAPMIA